MLWNVKWLVYVGVGLHGITEQSSQVPIGMSFTEKVLGERWVKCSFLLGVTAWYRRGCWVT